MSSGVYEHKTPRKCYSLTLVKWTLLWKKDPEVQKNSSSNINRYFQIHFCLVIKILVGGFNLVEKYLSNWILSPGRGEKKYLWNHHLENISKFHNKKVSSRAPLFGPKAEKPSHPTHPTISQSSAPPFWFRPRRWSHGKGVLGFGSCWIQNRPFLKLEWDNKDYIYIYGVFPKIGVPPNHPF